MTNQERIAYLVKGATERTASDAELNELVGMLKYDDTLEVTATIEQLLSKYKNIDTPILTSPEIEAMADSVLRADHGIKEQAKVITIWRRVAAAAVIVLLFSVGGYFILENEGPRQTASAPQQIKNDVAPGKSGAVLTLANGKAIVLDTAQNGKLLDNFTKNNESITVESAAMEYATLTTPRARTQQLTLSDGSKVWLNAASSVHFPTLFSGNERTVEITGEVYFEVAHNKAKPFHVKVNGMTVEVLGTHFNVNAYSDEAVIKTTLLEGSVKIVNGEKNVIIKPGQQATLDNDKLSAKTVDVDAVMAWQRGLFEFNNTELSAIMRQISRWYDVDIVYEGKPGNEKFGGGISKNLPLSNVLKLLEANGVQFRLDGKKLFVKP